MSNFKTRALMGASMIAAAMALAAGAQAQTLQGGGSTLLAPTWAQYTGCASTAAADVDPNGFYFNKQANGVNLKTSPPALLTACTHGTGTAAIPFVGSGSGAGQAALFGHNGAALVGTIPLLGFSHTAGSPTPEFTAASGVQYALSDNAMAQGDLDVYNFGTSHASSPTTPSTYQSVAITTAPKGVYGPLVQFPLTIDPVDLAYNKTSLTGLGSNTLILDRTAYCKIFAGQITNWNDSTLATLNGLSGVGTHTLTGGVSVPIKVVGRSDSSGTTSIFTRHLSYACLNTNGGPFTAATIPWAGGTTTVPTAIASVYDLQSGSSGVANEIFAQTGGIGYVGNDYIATTSNTHSLPSAKLINKHGDTVVANSTNALNAFTLTQPTGAAQSGQLNWVAQPAGPSQTGGGTGTTALALGDPTATNAYPIVGTSNFLGYTCYATVGAVTSFREAIEYIFANPQIITNAGLAPLPSAWTSDIDGVFLNTTDASNNLFLAHKVDGDDGSGLNVNSNCTASGIMGG